MIPTERFSNRVEDYVRARPRYPDAVVSWLRATFGLVSSATIADVGAGPGISAELFLRHGCTVFAVEPNDAMREAAIRRLGADSRFRAVNARAEATTLPPASMDAVVAAQAFHWFDREAFRAECTRILRPGGLVVLLWNVRRVDGSPFGAGYEALLRAFATDYLTVRHENVSDEGIAAFFGGPVERRVLENVQALDLDGLRSRLMSSSYAPVAGDPRHEPMLAALDALYRTHQESGWVLMEYDVKLYASRLTGSLPTPRG